MAKCWYLLGFLLVLALTVSVPKLVPAASTPPAILQIPTDGGDADIITLTSGVGTDPVGLGPLVRVSAPPGPATVPAVGIDRHGRLHVVWSDGGMGKFDIVYRQVEEQIPERQAQLSDTPGLSSGPKIAVGSDGILFVVWHDSTPPKTRLYLRRSTENGQHFDPAVLITPTTEGAFTPTIAVDSAGRVHIAWADKSPGNFDIFYALSQDQGQSFTTGLNLSANEGKSLVPAVATDTCARVYVAWYDDTLGQFEVFLKVSEDGGKTFGPPVNVSASPGLSGAPALATDGCGTLYVAWPDDSSGNFEILARRSVDGGKTFGSTVNLSMNPSISIRPSLAVGSNGLVHLVWADGKPEQFQIFYRCTTPDLAASSPPIQISVSRRMAGAPVAVVGSSTTAHIVWTDNDTGPFMIFTREVTNCQAP